MKNSSIMLLNPFSLETVKHHVTLIVFSASTQLPRLSKMIYFILRCYQFQLDYTTFTLQNLKENI